MTMLMILIGKKMVGQEIYELSSLPEQDSMTESHLCWFSVFSSLKLTECELKRVNPELSQTLEHVFDVTLE